jgi:hypothetical protein
VVQVKPYLLEGTEKSQKYAHMTYHQWLSLKYDRTKYMPFIIAKVWQDKVYKGHILF